MRTKPKSCLVRLDTESKAILDKWKKGLSYNGFIKTLDSDLKSLQRYRDVAKLNRDIENTFIDWKDKLKTFTQSQQVEHPR